MHSGKPWETVLSRKQEAGPLAGGPASLAAPALPGVYLSFVLAFAPFPCCILTVEKNSRSVSPTTSAEPVGYLIPGAGVPAARP